jgi:hypothetical protein
MKMFHTELPALIIYPHKNVHASNGAEVTGNKPEAKYYKIRTSAMFLF